MKDIRNFCIIAHIDHGKSTLADRLLELTRTLSERDMENQVLDDMDLEKEKGITIKSHAIQMLYSRGGKTYRLNLIDTPGHVDFSYEVSRSIASCEGALLVVDATQGVQAQTISNLYMAIDHGLEIIPVLNKIDMDSAQVELVTDEVCELLGCKPEEVYKVSARTGEGVAPLLDAIVDKIPAPEGDPEAPLQALIFDSVFNPFRGVIAYCKVVNGSIRKGEKVKFFATGMEYEVEEVGVLKMKLVPSAEIGCGDVGYVITGIKSAAEVKVGDTITHVSAPCSEAIAGFRGEFQRLGGVAGIVRDEADAALVPPGGEKLHLTEPRIVTDAEVVGESDVLYFAVAFLPLSDDHPFAEGLEEFMIERNCDMRRLDEIGQKAVRNSGKRRAEAEGTVLSVADFESEPQSRHRPAIRPEGLSRFEMECGEVGVVKFEVVAVLLQKTERKGPFGRSEQFEPAVFQRQDGAVFSGENQSALSVAPKDLIH